MMNKCELCKCAAETYCESDSAMLCWECDGKVHGANFLVARHSRTLLCRICKSLTPWKASGANLGRIVSVCQNCSTQELEEDVEEEEGENQVVPWTTTSAPCASSSSSSEDELSRKRRRGDLQSPQDTFCERLKSRRASDVDGDV